MLAFDRFFERVFWRSTGGMSVRLAILALLVTLIMGCGAGGAGPAAFLPTSTTTQARPTATLPAPPTSTLPPANTPTYEPRTLSVAPVTAQPDDLPVMLAAGAGHTCLLSGEQVRCWGAGQFGQVGAVVDGAFSVSGAPVTVKEVPVVVLAIAAGAYHTCALIKDGTVWCWGRNEFKELGERPAGDSGEPHAVAGITGGVAIAAYSTHTCVITDQGRVMCWGDGIAEPATVTGLKGEVRSLALGYQYACALNDQGMVQCWGAGEGGQLGNGAMKNSPIPVEVKGLPAPALTIAAGAYHACALVAGGPVWCWGGAAEPDPARPMQIQGFSGPAKAIAAGDGHTCVLLENGLVECLGDNYFGQLGKAESEPGTGMPSRGKPVPVLGISGVVGIAAGTLHTCVLLPGGAIRCWGDLSSGQGGDGTVRWE